MRPLVLLINHHCFDYPESSEYAFVTVATAACVGLLPHPLLGYSQLTAARNQLWSQGGVDRELIPIHANTVRHLSVRCFVFLPVGHRAGAAWRCCKRYQCCSRSPWKLGFPPTLFASHDVGERLQGCLAVGTCSNVCRSQALHQQVINREPPSADEYDLHESFA